MVHLQTGKYEAICDWQPGFIRCWRSLLNQVRSAKIGDVQVSCWVQSWRERFQRPTDGAGGLTCRWWSQHSSEPLAWLIRVCWKGSWWYKNVRCAAVVRGPLAEILQCRLSAESILRTSRGLTWVSRATRSRWEVSIDVWEWFLSVTIELSSARPVALGLPDPSISCAASYLWLPNDSCFRQPLDSGRV